MRTVAILALGAILSGCGGVPEQPVAPADGANAATPAPATTPEPGPSAIPAAKPAKTAIQTADYSFEFSYPAEAAAIPALGRWFEHHRAALVAELDKDTAAFREEAAEGDFEFRPYESTHDWQVVTDTPRFLSLSATTYVYTGGAHGSPGYDALVWDKAAGQRLVPTDVFTRPTRSSARSARRSATRWTSSGKDGGGRPSFAPTIPLMGARRSRRRR